LRKTLSNSKFSDRWTVRVCAFLGYAHDAKLLFIIEDWEPLMRVLLTAALVLSLTGTAYGQQAPVPGYREGDKPKSPREIESGKEAERAYKRSLDNIPDKGPSDPWGTVRSTDAPPASVAKAKKVKSGDIAPKP
jgi:hypothetical protein